MDLESGIGRRDQERTKSSTSPGLVRRTLTSRRSLTIPQIEATDLPGAVPFPEKGAERHNRPIGSTAVRELCSGGDVVTDEMPHPGFHALGLLRPIVGFSKRAHRAGRRESQGNGSRPTQSSLPVGVSAPLTFSGGPTEMMRPPC